MDNPEHYHHSDQQQQLQRQGSLGAGAPQDAAAARGQGALPGEQAGPPGAALQGVQEEAAQARGAWKLQAIMAAGPPRDMLSRMLYYLAQVRGAARCCRAGGRAGGQAGRQARGPRGRRPLATAAEGGGHAAAHQLLLPGPRPARRCLRRASSSSGWRARAAWCRRWQQWT